MRFRRQGVAAVNQTLRLWRKRAAVLVTADPVASTLPALDAAPGPTPPGAAHAGKACAPQPESGPRGCPACRRRMHRHGGLGDDRAAVHLRASRNARCSPRCCTPASSACLCGCRPLKSGSSEGWMLSCRPAQRATKPRRLDAHEARRGHTSSTRAADEGRVDGLVEGLAGRQGLVVDGDRRLEPCALRPGQARRVGPVRDDEHDLGGIVRRARRLDQRHHVGAAARDQDADALLGAHACEPQLARIRARPRLRPCPWLAISRRGRARSRRCGSAVSPGCRQQLPPPRPRDPCATTSDHADAAVERAQHLRIVETARSLQPAEHRRRPPGCEVDVRRHAVRQARAAGSPKARRR